MWKISSLSKGTVIQCGIAAVISVLLVSWLRIRPLGLFFAATFGLWYYKTRCNLRIVPPPELQKKLEQISQSIQNTRQNKPTMFCLVSVGCLSVLAIVGHCISGSTVVLTGLVLAAILSTKYNFKIIKLEQKDFAWAEKFNHDPEYDDEFLPDVDEKNRFVLERACDLASISSPIEDATSGVGGDENDEDKSDDIPSELLIPDPIPEINETSSDDDDSDLVPIVKNKQELLEAAQAQNSKSDLIEFKKGHFKRDSSLSGSSSSSEESLSKGLKFPDYTEVDAPALQKLPASQQTQEAGDILALAVKQQIMNSSKLIPSLVSGLVQWGMSGGGGGASPSSTVAVPTNESSSTSQRRVVTALDSSDESDFEILENEDFK